MKSSVVRLAALMLGLTWSTEVLAAGFISQKPRESGDAGKDDGRKEEEKPRPPEKPEKEQRAGAFPEAGRKETPDKPGVTPEKPRETPEKPKETPDKPKVTPDKPKETPEKPAKPKTEVEKAMDEHFERWDKDRDGKLSLAEFRTAYRGSDMGEGPRIFQERDGDKDGFLSPEEFGKIMPKKILSATEQDRIEGRDWKEEREKRERERERKKDRR